MAPSKSEARPNSSESEKYNPAICPEAKRKYLVNGRKEYHTVRVKTTVIKY